ncbi:MAG: hypothetical protein GF390_04180 [Candidatus Pacebacteria bacterium]|nr:hypothetical protein [Candidatus Paceibacterota bacterium]
MHLPFLIAHRGDRNNFPENSIEGFRSALAKGADGVEMDVQFFNGKLIVVHDYIFNQDKEHPTLQAVLREVKGKGRAEIEIKAFSKDIIQHLKDALIKNEIDNFELTTSVLPLILPLREAFPKANLGAIFNSSDVEPWMDQMFIQRKITELMFLTGANVAHVARLTKEQLTQDFVEDLHKFNFKVHSHIERIDMDLQLQMYHYLQEIGVDQCTFDDIDLLGAKELDTIIDLYGKIDHGLLS